MQNDLVTGNEKTSVLQSNQGCRFVSVVGGGGGGMIGAKIFSAMDQSSQEVEACGKLHPSQARSQDYILGGR